VIKSVLIKSNDPINVNLTHAIEQLRVNFTLHKRKVKKKTKQGDIGNPTAHIERNFIHSFSLSLITDF
jgi:hypothetical protein